MISVKKHETPEGHLLLAACDSELLGKEFEEGDLYLECKESFYGGEVVSDDEFNTLLNHCTHANLVGNYVVELAAKKNLVDGDHVKQVAGIRFAQFVKTAVDD